MHSGDEVKRREADRWSRNAAIWDGWADRMADMADRINRPLLAHLGVGEGMRVLDLASGAGEPALSAARLVGAGGEVIATDLVEEMLAGVRRRAAESGLEDRLRTRVADMERLPFGKAAFDVVCCRFGLMFSPEPGRAAAEALRVLKPGGSAGWAVFGPRADNTLLGALFTAAFEILTEEERGGVYTPFRFAELGEGEPDMPAILGDAGFVDIQDSPIIAEKVAPASDKDGNPPWRQPLEMLCGGAVETLPGEKRAALEAAIKRKLDPNRSNGGYRTRIHIRVLSGRKP